MCVCGGGGCEHTVNLSAHHTRPLPQCFNDGSSSLLCCASSLLYGRCTLNPTSSEGGVMTDPQSAFSMSSVTRYAGSRPAMGGG